MAGNSASVWLKMARMSVLIVPAACAACAGQSTGLSSRPQADITPAGQMADLYRQACLVSFPDRASFDRLIQSEHAVPMSALGVLKIVGGPHGEGWTVRVGTHSYQIVLQDPPYPSCAVRSTMARDSSPAAKYQDVLSQYANSKSLTPGDPQVINQPVGDDGEMRMSSTGLSNSSGTVVETSSYASTAFQEPVAGSGGTSASEEAEIRMAHQFLK